MELVLIEFEFQVVLVSPSYLSPSRRGQLSISHTERHHFSAWLLLFD